jgi:hypothetical protein
MRAFESFVRCRGWWWTALATLPWASLAGADTPPIDASPELVQRDLSGPRIGITYRPGGPSTSHGVGRLVSQFGWHSETQVVPRRGGPQFVIEVVPLVAGFEYGKFLPSVSLGLGVRLPSGYEFGLGPTVSLGGGNAESIGLGSALFVTAGRSFDYGGVSLPVNLVYAGNQKWSSLSVLVGYAIRRASQTIGAQDPPPIAH